MPMKKLRQTAHRRSHAAAAPIGAALLIFALIGVITVISLSYDFTLKLLDNSKEKNRFEQILLPVLMFDPIPFESVDTIDPLSLLQSSLWSTMLGEKRDSYTYDDNSRLVIPQSDVDMSAAALFGPNVTLSHQSFGDYEISYYYDAASKAYHVPVTAQTGFYTPSVITIDREKNTFTLLVGYVPPSTVWNISFDGAHTVPDPDKYMVYVFEKEDDNYRLSAIRYPTEEQLSGLELTGNQGIPNAS